MLRAEAFSTVTVVLLELYVTLSRVAGNLVITPKNNAAPVKWDLSSVHFVEELVEGANVTGSLPNVRRGSTEEFRLVDGRLDRRHAGADVEVRSCARGV